MFRSLIHYLKTYFYYVFDSAASCCCFHNSKDHKRLVIVRLDAIGDYVLFRNFLSEIKQSSQYKGYRITLCGNRLWKELSEDLDSDVIDETIWIERSLFEKNLFYRFRMISRLSSLNCDVVFQPVFSRVFSVGDSVVRALKAAKKVGCLGRDLRMQSLFQHRISDRFYTELIPVSEDAFEFLKNKEIVEGFLTEGSTLSRPMISIDVSRDDLQLPSSYLVVCPGAGSLDRQWPAQKFVALIEYLCEAYALPIVLLGAYSELEIGTNICNSVSKSFQTLLVNKMGDTSLSGSLKIISEATAVVCHDSSPAHFSAALNVPFVALSNGKHAGRFLPYPDEISNVGSVVYPRILLAGESSLESVDIKEILLEDVLHALEPYLGQ